jgi:hypothetical protein
MCDCPSVRWPASVNSLSDGGLHAQENRGRLRDDFDFRPAGCLPSHTQRSCAWNRERRGLPCLRRQLEMNITVDPYRHTCVNARSHGPLPAASAPCRARDALSWAPFRFSASGFVVARFIAPVVARPVARVMADKAPAFPPGLLCFAARMSVLMPSRIGTTSVRRFQTFPDPVSRDALLDRRAAAIASTRGT